MDNDNSFETLKKPEERTIPEGQDFQKSFEEDCPPFSGEWSYGSKEAHLDTATSEGEAESPDYDTDRVDNPTH